MFARSVGTHINCFYYVATKMDTYFTRRNIIIIVIVVAIIIAVAVAVLWKKKKEPCKRSQCCPECAKCSDQISAADTSRLNTITNKFDECKKRLEAVNTTNGEIVNVIKVTKTHIDKYKKTLEQSRVLLSKSMSTKDMNALVKKVEEDEINSESILSNLRKEKLRLEQLEINTTAQLRAETIRSKNFTREMESQSLLLEKIKDCEKVSKDLRIVTNTLNTVQNTINDANRDVNSITSKIRKATEAKHQCDANVTDLEKSTAKALGETTKMEPQLLEVLFGLELLKHNQSDSNKRLQLLKNVLINY